MRAARAGVRWLGGLYADTRRQHEQLATLRLGLYIEDGVKKEAA